MARVSVKAHPRARRPGVGGRVGDAWKLKLAAPPTDGAANEECVRFFAALCGVPRARVRIVSGAAARIKIVEVDGVPQEELEKRLAAAATVSGRAPGNEQPSH